MTCSSRSITYSAQAGPTPPPRSTAPHATCLRSACRQYSSRGGLGHTCGILRGVLERISPRSCAESLSGLVSGPASNGSLDRAAASGQNKMGPAKDSDSRCSSSWLKKVSPVNQCSSVSLCVFPKRQQNGPQGNQHGQCLCRGCHCSRTASPPLLPAHFPC